MTGRAEFPRRLRSTNRAGLRLRARGRSSISHYGRTILRFSRTYIAPPGVPPAPLGSAERGRDRVGHTARARKTRHGVWQTRHAIPYRDPHRIDHDSRPSRIITDGHARPQEPVREARSQQGGTELLPDAILYPSLLISHLRTLKGIIPRLYLRSEPGPSGGR